MRQRVNVLGVQVDAVNPATALDTLVNSAKNHSGGYVCVTGVHGVMESTRDLKLQQIHNESLLTVPDGMPMVWVGHVYGFRDMRRVYGPDLMLSVCGASVGANLSHFLCGGGPGVCDDLARGLTARFPGLNIAGMWTPPFRPLTVEERQSLADRVTASGAAFLWIGLSTPKQERFMADLTHLLPGIIMLGVGAAFDMHAGRLQQAPSIIQKVGLEWAYRLYREPRRLWRRYLRNNPAFVAGMVRQFLSNNRGRT